MSNLKLGVEVVSAHNLLAKDGKGSSNAFVELHFDNQKFRTTVKAKDLDPHFNETFYFQISDPTILSNLVLDLYIYSYVSSTESKSFLGKVKISGSSFVPHSDAAVMYYPLEKRNIFSRVKGELGLKVFIVDNHYVKSSNPFSSKENMTNQTNSYSSQNQEYQQSPNLISKKNSEGKNNSSHTFQNQEYHQQSPNLISKKNSEGKNNSSHTFHSLSKKNYQAQTQPIAPKTAHMYSGSSSQPDDFSPRETNPVLGGGQVIGGRVIPADRPSSTYDLVQPMQYLFVRIVKARDLPSMDLTGSLDPYIEVRVGNYKGVTKHFEKNQKPEWNTVFAFSSDRLQASMLDIVMKDKDMLKDDFVGVIRFDLNDVPTRVPPDSPLAPEWYWLENRKGDRRKGGEIMVSVWMGTQADEAFPDAWHADAASHAGNSGSNSYLRAKVYHLPRLWYVRVNVIEVQDLVLSENARIPNVYVKAQLGSQVYKTKLVQSRTTNALWNEDFVFVAAEPLDEYLVLMVEDRLGPNKDETLGKVIVSLKYIEKVTDNKLVNSRWFDLQKASSGEVDEGKIEKESNKFASKLHLRVYQDGGYHVLDESTQFSSDLRPTAKQLWKPSIGFLELGILDGNGIIPMKTRDGKGRSDTYCVARYGQKWVRTRTIMDSLNPKYNEQYTWEVYDTATVLTVGVFDNCLDNENRDKEIGKIRIRISTLGTGHVYTHTYPLLVLHPSGLKRMGELHLAIRFSCTSFMNMMYAYSRPLLPKMHYVRPLTINQLNMLKYQAVNIVATRLSRAEPPLRKEVVEYMTDAHSHLFSMRRSKANFFRLIAVFDGLSSTAKWFGEICVWKNPVTTVLVHILFVMLVCHPELILSTGFLYMFFIGIWNFKFKPKHPPHMDSKISSANSVHPDELDEEFDPFPTSKASPDVIRMRYDRLRSLAGKTQIVLGDLAAQGERVHELLSSRDPRATTIFVIFCLVASLVLYVTPFQVLAVIAGLYAMRHPRFRHKLPIGPINFFRRLPARTDSML